MPPRDTALRIADIRSALAAIDTYCAGMSYESFVADRRTVDAVIRNLIVIGEASARLPESFCRHYSTVPWVELRSMRNFIVHEYFGISDRILWETVIRNLPSISAAVKTIPG